MELWQLVLLAAIVLVAGSLVVLYRRQRNSAALGDAWTPGQHRSHVGNKGDTQPHTSGGGSGTAGLGGDGV